MNVLKAFLLTLCTVSSKSDLQKQTSIYDININSLQGQPIDFKAFKGKHILFVNVAFRKMTKQNSMPEVVSMPLLENAQLNFTFQSLITEREWNLN